MEVQSHFSPDSKEYMILDYRIISGQLFQQNEIDKLKGIIADPMPTSWYNYAACEKNEDQEKICANKKPYFMTYVYADYRAKYRNYIQNCDKTSREMFGISLDLLQKKFEKDAKELKFLRYFDKKSPFGRGVCSINQICYFIEDQFAGIVTKTKAVRDFDYGFLRRGEEIADGELLTEAIQLIEKYVKSMRSCSSKEDQNKIRVNSDSLQQASKAAVKKYYKNELQRIIPDNDLRLNTVLYLCYERHMSNSFMWDCIGDLIVDRIKELNSDNTKRESIC